MPYLLQVELSTSLLWSLADRPNRADRGRVGGDAGDGGLDARARVRLRAPRPAPGAPAQGGLCMLRLFAYFARAIANR